jgi:hypothetical protein
MQFGQLNRRRFITPLASAAGSSLTVIVKTTIAIVLAIGTGTSSLALGPDDLESTSCSNESLTFMAWRTFAGRADQARLKGIPNVTKEDFVTRDGRALRGYHLASPTGSAKGYVLVAQGNAQLADWVISVFPPFANALGLDVYVFDYRGYGNSEGKSTIRAIFDDYKSISAYLNTKSYRHHYLYGISFGAVIVMNAIGLGASYDGAIIDSPPAKLSGFGCPTEYDPIVNVPADASKIWIISGLADKHVPAQYVRPLGELVQSRGGKFSETNFGHPLQASWSEWLARIEMFRSHLQGK